MTVTAKRREVDMLSGNSLGRIFLFSLPLMAGNLFTQLYSIVDAAIVGQFVGVNGFAAIGCTGWIVWLMGALCRDASSAVCILASYQIGARRTDEFKRVAATSAYMGTILTIAICGIVLGAVDPLLRLVQVPAEIYEEARVYLVIYALGLPFTMICSMASALLRAAGNSRTPFYAMTVSAAVNVVLDLVFVIGLDGGVAGAAWATLIAQAVSALIAMLGILRKEPYRTGAGDWALRKDLLKEAFRLFLPMFWNSTVITAGGMYVQSHVNGAGAAFSAGFTAAIKLFNLFEAIVMAIQTALSVFIGQNLGGGQIHRINGGFYRTMAVTMGIMVFFTVCVYLFGEQMVRLFLSAKDQAAYQTAVQIACLELRYLMPSGVVMVAMFFFRAGVQALGRPNCIFIAGIVQMAVRILTIVILYPLLGTTSYLLTDQTAWIVSLPVVMFPFIRHVRQLEKQTVLP